MGGAEEGRRALRCDTRQHAGKHELKERWWREHGVPTVTEKLDFGDYMVEGSNVSVDTKRNVDEIAMNINGPNHDRFKRECVRARDAGCRLVVLVENRQGYTCIENVSKWTNGHCAHCLYRYRKLCSPKAGGKCPRHNKRKPIQGGRLAKAMRTMETRYGVRFEFCRPEDAGRRVCELLGIDYEKEGGNG